jgi:hypothetical protein
LGKDLEKVKNATLKTLDERLPYASKAVNFLSMFYFHGIVLVAVTTFLVILSLMNHNVLNDIS